MLSYALVACLSVLVAVLFLPPDWSVDLGKESQKLRLLSRSDLSLYNGEKGSRGVYLAILGQVFDVHKGHKHYGPGGAYQSMAGKDASLAFITGDFTEKGLIDDVSSLSPLQVVALYDWLAFYHRQYQHVGLPKKWIRQLQLIQNVENMDQVLKSFHWLPVSQRIDFKILLLVYKSLN